MPEPDLPKLKAKLPNRLKTMTCWFFHKLEPQHATKLVMSAPGVSPAPNSVSVEGAESHAPGSGSDPAEGMSAFGQELRTGADRPQSNEAALPTTQAGLPLNRAALPSTGTAVSDRTTSARKPDRLVSEQAALEEPPAADLAQLQEEYDVLGIVGESPVCRVYKVRNKRLGAVMALKVLKDEFATSTAAEKQFEREVNAATTLCHPNIVPIYGHGRLDNNASFVVEKLCDNARNLAQVIQQEGHLEPQRAISLFAQVADAMDHAHSKAVTHGDLKPSNIVITGSVSEKSSGEEGLAQAQTPSNQPSIPERRQIGTHMWRLLISLLLFVSAASFILIHANHRSAWGSAFDDYNSSASTMDGAATVEIAEGMLKLSDDRHMPMTMALAAEAYWRNGNDARAKELLKSDIELCRKSNRYLSAINACEIQFDQQIQAGDLKAARDSAKQARDLVIACADTSKWQESKSPIRVEEDEWYPLLKQPWAYALLRNLGVDYPEFEDTAPMVGAFDFKWDFIPPDRTLAHFCQTFMSYGDMADALYFSDQMLNAGSREMVHGWPDRAMYEAISTVASFRLGQAKTSSLQELAGKDWGLSDTSASLHVSERRWALAQLAALCVANGNIRQADSFFAGTPGVFISKNAISEHPELSSQLVSKAIDESDEFDSDCDEPTVALAQNGQIERINTMYQTLLSLIESSNSSEPDYWESSWFALDAQYIDYLTKLKRIEDAHRARQQALDKIRSLSDENLQNENLSHPLLRIVGSAILQNDLNQAKEVLLFLRKYQAPDTDFDAQSRIIDAELLAYQRNIKGSISQLSKLLHTDDNSATDDPTSPIPDRSSDPLESSQSDQNLEIHSALAKLYFLSGNLNQSISEYEKAIELATGDSNFDNCVCLSADLACAYNQAGNSQKAQEEIEKLLKIWRRMSHQTNAYVVSRLAKQFPDLLKKAPSYVFPLTDSFDSDLPDWRALRRL